MEDSNIKKSLKKMGYKFLMEFIELFHPNPLKELDGEYFVYYNEDKKRFISYQQLNDGNFSFVTHRLDKEIKDLSLEEKRDIAEYCLGRQYRDEDIYIGDLFLRGNFITCTGMFKTK